MKRTIPFTLSCEPLPDGSTQALWFLMQGATIFLAGNSEHACIPQSALPPIPVEAITYRRSIGSYGNRPCIVLELQDNSAASLATSFTAVSLREAHGLIGEELWTIAGRASQILRWNRDHQFCGRCGTMMEEEEQDILRRCPRCDFFTYPRISPAVIMSVIKDDKILLGRSPRFPSGMFSVLAGFVEPGETLEEAVAREVKEEVDIDIKDIRYIGSQPWPFPHSLMVGFVAQYAGGTITIDNKEIEEAGWFRRDEMPRLPTKISIARRLVEMFLEDSDGP